MAKKNPGAGRQQTLAGVVPPMNLAQERAVDYLNAKRAAAIAAEKAKDALDDMIAAAQKLGLTEIKVRNDANDLVVFMLDNKVAVKKSVLTDVKIEKVETEGALAAGGAGPRA